MEKHIAKGVSKMAVAGFEKWLNAPKTIDDKQSAAIISVDKRLRALKQEQESKYKDVYAANQSTNNTTGTFHLLNGLGQGSGPTERDGEKAKVMSLRLRFSVQTNIANADSQRVRIMIFKDRFAKGTEPTLANLLRVATITDPVVAPYESDYFGRFKFYYDKVLVFNPQYALDWTTTGGVTANDNVGRITKYQKVNRRLGFQVTFNQDATTIGAININSLYMFVIGDAASNVPTYTLGSRIYFRE